MLSLICHPSLLDTDLNLNLIQIYDVGLSFMHSMTSSVDFIRDRHVEKNYVSIRIDVFVLDRHERLMDMR